MEQGKIILETSFHSFFHGDRVFMLSFPCGTVGWAAGCLQKHPIAALLLNISDPRTNREAGIQRKAILVFRED